MTESIWGDKDDAIIEVRVHFDEECQKIIFSRVPITPSIVCSKIWLKFQRDKCGCWLCILNFVIFLNIIYKVSVIICCKVHQIDEC